MINPQSIATLDLRIDYMRAAEPGREIIAVARCYKLTRSIAFVRGAAFEDDENDPVATAQAAFALTRGPVGVTPDRAERLAAMLAAVPYMTFLGMSAGLAGDEMTAVLPFADHLVGNTHLPALHGGVLGAFLEMTALCQLAVREPQRRQPRTIDVTIEYLRPGRALTTYARADVRKIGRRIANVHVEAWQESRASPIAALRGHFMLSLDDAKSREQA